MADKKGKLTESVHFLAWITFVGGFLNAYSYGTRNKFLCNGMTGNMSKMGISLGQGNIGGFIDALTPVLCAIAGAVLSEVIRVSADKKKDWRRTALLVQAMLMAMVAFLPLSVPDVLVTRILCLIVGYQLCLFRTCQWGAHNTTICTGNLRSVGQYLFSAVYDRTEGSKNRFVFYTLLVISFSVGSFVATLLCSFMSTYALLAACLVNIMLYYMIRRDEEGARAAA